MLFKIITSCDGYNAPKLAARIAELGRVPTFAEIDGLVNECDFGGDRRVILELGPQWNRPVIYSSEPTEEWDPETLQRYLDTFHVAQFNPRWKYGIADYVEVVDLSDSEDGSEYTLTAALAEIEACHYECEAGKLENNVAWIWLKGQVRSKP